MNTYRVVQKPDTQFYFGDVGGWKNFVFTRHKFLLVAVKEWLKSVLNYRNYPKNKTSYLFLDHPVYKTDRE